MKIYNGNLDRASFENVILERFGRWDGEGQIFECSIFQNIIENQMLYLMMTDDEIISFYQRLERVLAGRSYQIIYLDAADISGTLEVIKKERSDEQGKELWFPMMIRYLEKSPYGKQHALCGMEGLVRHLERRKALEHRLLNEIFVNNATIVESKNYKMDDIV